MLISLSIGLVNVDDISLVRTTPNEHEITLIWRSSSNDDYSIISEADYLTLIEISKRQYQMFIQEVNDE
jgi:hypothetical protein